MEWHVMHRKYEKRQLTLNLVRKTSVAVTCLSMTNYKLGFSTTILPVLFPSVKKLSLKKEGRPEICSNSNYHNIR